MQCAVSQALFLAICDDEVSIVGPQLHGAIVSFIPRSTRPDFATDVLILNECIKRDSLPQSCVVVQELSKETHARMRPATVILEVIAMRCRTIARLN